MHGSQIRYERRKQCLPSITDAQSTFLGLPTSNVVTKLKRNVPSRNPQWASMKSWGIFTRSKLAHALDKTFTLTLWQCLDFFDVLLCSHLLLGSGSNAGIFPSPNILKINSHRDGTGDLLPPAAFPEFTAARIIVRHHDNHAFESGPA